MNERKSNGAVVSFLKMETHNGSVVSEILEMTILNKRLSRSYLDWTTSDDISIVALIMIKIRVNTFMIYTLYS